MGSIQARGALVCSLLQPQLLCWVTHSIAGTWEPRPLSCLWDWLKLKVSLRDLWLQAALSCQNQGYSQL